MEKLGFRVHALAKVSDLVKSLSEQHISKEQAYEVLAYVKSFQAPKNTT